MNSRFERGIKVRRYREGGERKEAQEEWRCCKKKCRLTAVILDGTADTRLINRPASCDAERALLHQACRLIPDAVAELAGIVGVDRQLGAVGVEALVDVAAIAVGEAELGGARGQGVLGMADGRLGRRGGRGGE